MLRVIMLAILGLVAGSCQPEFESKNPFTYYQKDAQFYQQFVNAAAAPESVDRSKVLTLRNDEFPMELALFGDNRFYYYMETLGDGFGTWEFDQDKLHLYAERTLFVMHMNIRSIDEADNQIAVDFIDRFGTQYLTLDPVPPLLTSP